jgi:hypothetical protein
MKSPDQWPGEANLEEGSTKKPVRIRLVAEESGTFAREPTPRLVLGYREGLVGSDGKDGYASMLRNGRGVRLLCGVAALPYCSWPFPLKHHCPALAFFWF